MRRFFPARTGGSARPTATGAGRPRRAPADRLLRARSAGAAAVPARAAAGARRPPVGGDLLHGPGAWRRERCPVGVRNQLHSRCDRSSNCWPMRRRLRRRHCAGAVPAPGLMVRAIGAGAVPSLPGSGLRGGARRRRGGPLVRARRRRHADRPARALASDPAVERCTTPPPSGPPGLEPRADQTEAVYDEFAGSQHDTRGAGVPKRLESRELIDVDLHMHTDHSATARRRSRRSWPPRASAASARSLSPTTTRSPARSTRTKAGEYGVKVIVGEEVKTAEQGEVIGLFLEGKIRRVDAGGDDRRDQAPGGLVYVPHPFDRLHTVPDTCTCSTRSTTSTRSRPSTRGSRCRRSTMTPSDSPPTPDRRRRGQ